jgi:hypothetical protein
VTEIYRFLYVNQTPKKPIKQIWLAAALLIRVSQFGVPAPGGDCAHGVSGRYGRVARGVGGCVAAWQ